MVMAAQEDRPGARCSSLTWLAQGLSSTWLHSLVEQLPDAVLLEYEGRIIFANPAACRLYGFESVARAASFSLAALAPAADQDRLADLIAELKAGRRSSSTEEQAFSPNGQLIPIQATRMLVPYGDSDAICMIATDISHRKQIESALRHEAAHDPLTGLANRSHLLRLLDRAAARRRGDEFIALGYVDLDRFKQVNDTYGHTVGDLLLKSVAARLTGSVRKTDLVARMGGDEFVILFDGYASEQEIGSALHRILACIAQPQDILGQSVSVTCSIGCSLLPRDSQLSDKLICLSDAAMYQAKKAGGNRVHLCGRPGSARSDRTGDSVPGAWQ